jgi:hypothetical protein
MRSIDGDSSLPAIGRLGRGFRQLLTNDGFAELQRRLVRAPLVDLGGVWRAEQELT